MNHISTGSPKSATSATVKTNTFTTDKIIPVYKSQIWWKHFQPLLMCVPQDWRLSYFQQKYDYIRIDFHNLGSDIRGDQSKMNLIPPFPSQICFFLIVAVFAREGIVPLSPSFAARLSHSPMLPTAVISFSFFTHSADPSSSPESDVLSSGKSQWFLLLWQPSAYTYGLQSHSPRYTRPRCISDRCSQWYWFLVPFKVKASFSL